MCQLKNNWHGQISSVNNGARGMEFGSFNGRDDRECGGGNFVEISKIVAIQDTFFFKMKPFVQSIVTRRMDASHHSGSGQLSLHYLDSVHN